jgi:flagellar basal body-associated protein FliL
MNSPRSTKRFSPFILLMALIALGIATTGAITHVTYRNKQIQTAREIEATEKRIASLVQDDIPSVQAEIDRQLARYDLREKLQRNRSTLVSTPSHRIEVIRVKNPSVSQQPVRP